MVRETNLIGTAEQISHSKLPSREVLRSAFFWLCSFYVVYCARPGDWIPGLSYIPLAKIAGVAAFLSLLASLGKTQRKFNSLPRESQYLLGMIGLLSISGLLSPIWKGGAVSHTLDFSKVYVAWVLTFMLLTSFDRFRRIIFIQSASVALICIVSILKGRTHARLEGVIGGIYSNPNDLAFAIVLSLPFCLAFFIQAKGAVRKSAWLASVLVMMVCLSMTASRGGFVTLLVSGAVCLWHFGVRGRRFFLIVGAALVTTIVLFTTGATLMDRFRAITSSDEMEAGHGQEAALESYESRKFLMEKAIEGIEQYPILGVGARNFPVYSTIWQDVHMTYLQIAVEGGIPAAILYLLFFRCSFANLKQLRKRRDLDKNTVLFVGALHSSMVGFVVGALFSPESYQFFPYFAVAYTSALVAIVRERDQVASPADPKGSPQKQYSEVRVGREAGDPVPSLR
jgi:O-antigen ligase